MKTDLSHLPIKKKEELHAIKDIILGPKAFSIEMIILFGSYARGDYLHKFYVDEGRTKEKISDYDILCVIKSKKIQKNFVKWSRLRDTIRQQNFSAPTTIIYHTIKFLNHEIEDHNSFFCDIIKDGIMLYNSGNYELSKPGTLTSTRLVEKANEAFQHKLETADSFYKISKQLLNENIKHSAFELHQATENYYLCFIDVYTNYNPNTHDLEELDKRMVQIKPEMYNAFSKESKEDNRLFELLNRAYVGARYKKNYYITKEELKVLSQKVEKFRDIIKNSCQEYIKNLEKLIIK